MLYDLADSKHTTVAELTGTRRKYSRIRVPQKLQSIVGEEYVIIDHIDEGINAAEINMWAAFYEIKNEQERRASK